MEEIKNNVNYQELTRKKTLDIYSDRMFYWYSLAIIDVITGLIP